MKDYKDFSVTDFIIDEDFQSWILHPNESKDAFWQYWIAEYPQKKKEFQEAQDFLRGISFSNYTLSSGDVAELWKRVTADQGQGITQTEVTHKRKKYRWYWSAAAILVFAVVFSLRKIHPDTMVYATSFGETKTIVLPDRSTVILNANSRISLANNWSEKPVREITLEGEAYFSVVHQYNHQPFRVTTEDGVAVEVLGTTFNIYHRTIDTKVVLNTGQIRLSIPDEKNHKIIMKPGELVEFKKNTICKRSVNPKTYLAWTENKIILDHTTLKDILRIAEDNYGIRVGVTSEKLLRQTVSGSMPIGGDVESFMNCVAKVFQVTVAKKDDSFMIKE